MYYCDLFTSMLGIIDFFFIFLAVLNDSAAWDMLNKCGANPDVSIIDVQLQP